MLTCGPLRVLDWHADPELELGTRSTPNDRSTTDSRDGYVATIIKQDSELRLAQVYS
jgi:hypothetical protein